MAEWYLQTKRLGLREFVAHDAELICMLDSDPEVMRFINGGLATPHAEAKALVERVIAQYRRFQGRLGFWIACHLPTNDFAGWFHLRPDPANPEANGRAELGYRLRRDFWGQGLATEGSKALLNYGFTTLQVPEIFARTVRPNFASVAVMRKLGMQFRRTYAVPEHPGDGNNVIEFGITRPEWLKLNGAGR